MTLVRYQNPMPGLLNSFFDNAFDLWSNKNYSKTNTTLPSINVKETTDAFEVEVAAPGFEKKDFNIELDNNLLTVSSEKQEENEVKDNERYTLREFSYQSFSRSFTLPEVVEEDKISAKYEDGILRVVIPKKEEAKPKPVQKIAVA